MLAALLIVFREVFEAGLIVGIVMAVTVSVAGRGFWVAGGVVAGVLGACVVAVFTGGLSQLFGGSGQEVFNAGILAFAVVMLTWHNVWMARHGRQLAAELKAAGEAVVAGSKSLAALTVVVAVAVLREGSEVVLFLYGVAAAQAGASWGMVTGGFIGLIRVSHEHKEPESLYLPSVSLVALGPSKTSSSGMAKPRAFTPRVDEPERQDTPRHWPLALRRGVPSVQTILGALIK